MADPKLVDILKQGSEVWNRWRKQQPAKQIFDLDNADLRNANLSSARLSHVHLNNADLSGAKLVSTHLSNTTLIGSNLRHADLRYANLRHANLHIADLCATDLRRATICATILSEARLLFANLRRANLSEANLSKADLHGATIHETIFARIDLSTVKGLAEIKHGGPSYVELHTVQLPQDGSALHFLRGAGVPDEWIADYNAHTMLPIQYHSCFISYAHQDNNLARRLHSDLQDKGVRCWFAQEDLKTGDKHQDRIDEAIQVQDKLLLLLSENALASSWVEDEVCAALEKERRQQREVLFPIRLDNAVMETKQAWAAKLRRQRHIGDFTAWTDPPAYQQAFDRLLRDLKKVDE